MEKIIFIAPQTEWHLTMLLHQGKNLNNAQKLLNTERIQKGYKGHFKFANFGEKVDLNSKKTAKTVEMGYVINKLWYKFKMVSIRYQYGENILTTRTINSFIAQI